MDTRRVILYAALAFVVFSLWNAWKTDYPPVPVVKEQLQSDVQSNDGHLLPANLHQESSSTSPEVPAIKADIQAKNNVQQRVLPVKTDVLDVDIDLLHGDVVKAELLDYPVSIDKKDKPVSLLFQNAGSRYVANSSLLVMKNGGVQSLQVQYQPEQSRYTLSPDQKTMQVVLDGQTSQGIQVKKIFEFEKGSYLIKVRYVINNTGSTDWKGFMNTQLLRSSPEEDKSSFFHVGSFIGASYSNPGEHRYKKVGFSNMEKQNLDVDAKGGWIAMQQHYFLSAWVPPSSEKTKFYTRAKADDYTIGAVSQTLNVKAGEEKEVGSELYIGPEITSTLNSISPTLGMTVDYGLLWFLSSILFSVMKFIYSFVGNWGWSIVLVTLFIKLAFYRLSASSYRSMAGMRKLQPKLQAIREKYADDKAKVSQATMELYRKEKINPLGGCLPILIQIPVFIALYWVLIESVELRQAPFIFWIKDLATADPYHVLPLIMGATMLIQQKLNPSPPDPVQAKVMMLLPLMFTALFWNFPAGLVLYWIVNNTLSILQQWYITRKYSNTPPNPKKLVAANK